MKKTLFSLLIVFTVSVCFACADGAKLTTKPILLPKGTDGSYGTEGTYVLFGDWPQSVKEDDVTISSNKEKNVNGWECYKGSDGFYYVKVEAWTNHDEYEFDNGKAIKEGEEYYFKLEPIKWRVLSDDYQGGKLLVAENVLLPRNFFYGRDIRKINGKRIISNNYKYSNIRAFLNGLNGTEYEVEDFSDKGFINKAFTKKAIEIINTVIVDNSKESTGYDRNGYACEDTEDKIFLLSIEEVTNIDYGFVYDEDEYDKAKIRKPTDYSRAIGDSGVNTWLLRSPCSEAGNGIRIVSSDGNTPIDHISFPDGVVPALSISF